MRAAAQRQRFQQHIARTRGGRCNLEQLSGTHTCILHSCRARARREKAKGRARAGWWGMERDGRRGYVRRASTPLSRIQCRDTPLLRDRRKSRQNAWPSRARSPPRPLSFTSSPRHASPTRRRRRCPPLSRQHDTMLTHPLVRVSTLCSKDHARQSNRRARTVQLDNTRTQRTHRDGTGPQQTRHQTHAGRRGRGQHAHLDPEEPQQEADAEDQVIIAAFAVLSRARASPLDRFAISK